MKFWLEPIVGTPPRPLEKKLVEKHARMAEREHGGRRRGAGFSKTLPVGRTHVV